MLKNRARVFALAAVVLFVSACQTDEQETQKFDRADADSFRRDMSAMTSITLSNGVSVYVQEERTDSRVAIEVLYRGGIHGRAQGRAPDFAPRRAHGDFLREWQLRGGRRRWKRS